MMRSYTGSKSVWKNWVAYREDQHSNSAFIAGTIQRKGMRAEEGIGEKNIALSSEPNRSFGVGVNPE
jgi:hypothetical protein